MTSPQPAIAFVDCGKRFGDRWLWRGVDLAIFPGEIVALVGPSGSGKSTLLNCAGMLTTPTTGNVQILGRDVHSASLRQRRRLWAHTIGYLFQDFALIEGSTIRANVEVVFGLALTPAARRARGERIGGALEDVGLGGREREPVYRLSGGEKQRVSIARLLAKRPAVILADEPTGSLDDANAERVLGHLRALASTGAGVLIATHSHLVVKHADRIIDVTALGSEGLATEEGCEQSSTSASTAEEPLLRR
jgi:putative ABC transport system ATP-binding protein